MPHLSSVCQQNIEYSMPMYSIGDVTPDKLCLRRSKMELASFHWH